MAKVHNLNLLDVHYKDVAWGIKTFEVRKNDRDFKKDDIVNFYEVDSEGERTGDRMFGYEIAYIFYGGQFGLDEDYCIFNW